VAEDSSESPSKAIMSKINSEIETRVQAPAGLWTYYSEFILQNLGESSILLLENGEEKAKGITGTTSGPLTDYFKDTNQRMQFAKWFRPLTFIILAACLFNIAVTTFQADPALA
jgi:hypothetical protein